MSSGDRPSLPWTLLRTMADNLDFLERRTPQRQVARSSRMALAEHYGTSPTVAIRGYRQYRSPVSAAHVRRAILSGQRGVSGGESTNSDSDMSSSDDEQ